MRANTDVAGIGPAHRESFDIARLSPMTKTVPVATATEPNRRGPQESGLGGMSSGASLATYGSTSGVPLMVTFPAESQQAMVVDGNALPDGNNIDRGPCSNARSSANTDARCVTRRHPDGVDDGNSDYSINGACQSQPRP
jgi:hypothetical protein